MTRGKSNNRSGYSLQRLLISGRRCLPAWVIGHNHDSGIGDVVTVAIMLQVVPNGLSICDCDVLVQDGSPNLAVPSDDAVIEDNRIFDNCSSFDIGVPTEHRTANCSA